MAIYKFIFVNVSVHNAATSSLFPLLTLLIMLRSEVQELARHATGFGLQFKQIIII